MLNNGLYGLHTLGKLQVKSRTSEWRCLKVGKANSFS